MKTTLKVRKQTDLFRTYLTAKNYSKRTIEQYCSILKTFLSDFNEYPRDITADQITEWISLRGNPSTMGQYRGALKNYYTHVIGQPNKFNRIPYPKKEQKSPQILSKQIVTSGIQSIENTKHRMIVSVLYGAGLRLSELLSLRITDIDGHRNTIFVRHGKGGKDRVIPISRKLIQDLRNYFREYRPTFYLFEGQKGGRYTPTSVQKICRKHMKCNPHLLRHCNLTHLIESGVHISEVSKRAGHSKIETTHSTYSHIATTFNPVTII